MPGMLGEKTNGIKITLAKSRTEGHCTSTHTPGDPCVGTWEGKEKRKLWNDRMWPSRMGLSIELGLTDQLSMSSLSQSTNPCKVLTVHQALV